MLIDRVVEIELGKSIVAYKNVTVNEPFFQGHFPHQPIMPGVLVIEACAQAAGVLGFKSQNKKPKDGFLYYFVVLQQKEMYMSLEKCVNYRPILIKVIMMDERP